MSSTLPNRELALCGGIAIIAAILVAALAYQYRAEVAAPLWAVVGSCLAVVSLGLATLALAFGRRKLGLLLYLSFLTGAIGIAATLALSKSIGICVAALSGISVPRPELVCQSAYAVSIVSAVVLLSYVFVGYLGRQNAA